MPIASETWRYFGFASPFVATVAYVGFLSLFPGSISAIIDAVVMLLVLMSATALLLWGAGFRLKSLKLSLVGLLITSSLISLTAMILLNLFVLFATADI